MQDDDVWRPPRVPSYVPMALRPANPYSGARQAFLDELRAEFFGGVALRGFHCTRLTDSEVAAIRSEGMTPPNAVMLRRRIEALRDAGLITANVASKLIERNDADSRSRAGLVYFVFTRAPLRSESGVGSLLRFWGGEALYSRHDLDSETGPVLASIGSPRIVEASLPVSTISDGFLDGVMVQQFLAARGADTMGRDFESRTDRPIPSSSIRRVISRTDVEFETLTQSATWWQPL